MRPFSKPTMIAGVLTAVVCALSAYGLAQATSIPSGRQITPEELANFLQKANSKPPLMIQVGSHVLYAQAHIPGSEYVGPASTEKGLEQLRKRVEGLPRSTNIVLYCGCCPWTHCPNVKPAYDLLNSMGFTNFKVLYIADNFGANWVDKGYPTAKGE